MRAATIGIIEHEDIARCDCSGVIRNDCLHARAHRTQMNRHVWRIGNQGAACIEDRAGKIEPLLDVHRMGGVLQAIAHLLGNRHEEIAEDFEHHRIGVSADRMQGCTRRHAAQDQIAARAHGGAPADVDDRGRGGIAHDCRAIDDRADRQRLAIEEWRVPPLACRVERHDCPRCGRRNRVGLPCC